jgi:hypothetical protein
LMLESKAREKSTILRELATSVGPSLGWTSVAKRDVIMISKGIRFFS